MLDALEVGTVERCVGTGGEAEEQDGGGAEDHG
jgi:hypothetical protein